jgi:predicted phosphodiesterase
VSSAVIRIFSDLHYGDRASTLRVLSQIKPLFEGCSQIILNGDTLDTRPSRFPATTLALRAEVADFFTRYAPPATWLTGNHDPDISSQHAVELRDRRVYATHGDILFENLVPWGRDASVLRKLIEHEFAHMSPAQRGNLDEQFAATRRVAASIPQRHQSERNPIKYAAGFLMDTVWPPLRILDVLKAWRESPARAAAFLRRHQLPARVFVMGHTHRLGATQAPDGLIVINTGSFGPPCTAGVVDVATDHVRLRSVVRKRDAFCLGNTIAEFALAQVPNAETLIA